MPDNLTNSTPNLDPQTPPTEENFEAWVEKQDPAVKTLYTAHVTGLKTALDSERKANKDAQTRLKELSKKAEEGSDLRKALDEQITHLGELERQAAFQDKAHSAGVRNLRLAYIAAVQEGLVDSKGECDFAKLKLAFPELFVAVKVPAGTAGEGTGTTPDGKMDMNQAIRRALGRN